MAVVEPFTDEDVLDRFLFYCDECQLFIEVENRLHADYQLRYDQLVMLNVVQSTMDDIYRYKVYHQSGADGLSNSVKRAAYFTKWMMKLRPIYNARIPSEDGAPVNADKFDGTLLANEVFAVQRGMMTIAAEMGVEKISLDHQFQADFMYDLRYRSISADALLSIFSMIKDAAEEKSAVARVFRE